jgi:hypothetical protein
MQTSIPASKPEKGHGRESRQIETERGDSFGCQGIAQHDLIASRCGDIVSGKDRETRRQVHERQDQHRIDKQDDMQNKTRATERAILELRERQRERAMLELYKVHLAYSQPSANINQQDSRGESRRICVCSTSPCTSGLLKRTLGTSTVTCPSKERRMT